MYIGVALQATAQHYANRERFKTETNPFNPFPAKLIYLYFPPLEVVSRYRDPQLQVGENLNRVAGALELHYISIRWTSKSPWPKLSELLTSACWKIAWSIGMLFSFWSIWSSAWRCWTYCRSGNIRKVLIFAHFARSTNSRIPESPENY